MKRLFAGTALLLTLLAMACGAGHTESKTGSAASLTAPAASTVSAAGWTRPANVEPLTQPLAAANSLGGKAGPAAGKFTVVSNTPWPGQKVRVFFFGIQG